MDYEETANQETKPLTFRERITKKKVIICATVFVICAAVAVNWILFSGSDKTGFTGFDKSSGMSSTYGSQETKDASSVETDAQKTSDSYFSSTQVSRTRARDEALEVLQSVVDSSESDDASKTAALADISQIAKDMEAESNIETLVMAKGFEQCVAVISSGTINVVVKAEQLKQSDISIINEIVYEQAGISPSDIKIIQK